jgi:hypothetical protein
VLAGGSIGELVMSRPGKPYRVRLSLDDGAVHGGAGGLREVGGLVTSAFLMLEVLPVLYTLWRQAQLRRAHARGVPIAAIVGRPPPRARDSL